MKGIKKIFMLATMLCVVFMCVGCVKPTKQEHNISMDDNEKGTYSIKYTFSKSTFENTTYGTYSSYDTYVSDLENLVSQDVNMDLSVDSKSSTKNLYVTVEIDFSSLKDLNAKLNKVYANSNKVYNANIQEDKEINEYKLINNACANDNLDTVLQEELYNNGIEFDVNSEQYKVLNYAFTTGEKVYSLADVEKVKSEAIAYESNKLVNYSENQSESELVYMEKDKNGKKRMAVKKSVCGVVFDYLYNVSVANQDKIWNKTSYFNKKQEYMNKAIITNKTAICKKYVKEIKKYVEETSTTGVCNLGNVSTYELMEKVYSIDTSFVSIYKSYFKDLIKVYVSYFKTTETVSENIISAKYANVICNEVVEEEDTTYVYVEEPTVQEEVDDSPKTGDALPVELMIALAVGALLASTGCVVVKRKNRI